MSIASRAARGRSATVQYDAQHGYKTTVCKVCFRTGRELDDNFACRHAKLPENYKSSACQPVHTVCFCVWHHGKIRKIGR
jgi:hypothetical protein